MGLRRAAALLGVAGALVLPGAATAAGRDLSPLADTFTGTQVAGADFGTGGGVGATFPGAAVPFGLTQFSPDTTPASGNLAGGYEYTDDQIRGFSLTHFSGAGCALLRDIPVLPTTTPVTASPAVPGTRNVAAQYVPEFDHVHESAAPGRYHVVLDPGTPRAIGSDLTATTRTADGRFAFPATRNASVLLGAGGSALADGAASTRIRPGAREVTGSVRSGNFCFQPSNYRVYFAARFSRPFKAWGTWRRGDLHPGARAARDRDPHPSYYAGAQAGAYVTFDARRHRAVSVRIGVSYVSVAGARHNLRAEAGGRSFGALRQSAEDAWHSAMGRVRVTGGTAQTRRTMATSLYHALVGPNVSTDVDGRYTGMDGRVHRAAHGARYANVSGWDIYRTQSPLMALLAPGRASDLATSLVDGARESGCLPRWPYANQQTNVMVGDPSDPIIAGVHAFGARAFPARAALRRMTRGAERPCHSANGDYTEREALRPYERLGYVPQNLNVPVGEHTFSTRSKPWGSTSTSLEYNVADAAIAALAGRLGDRGLAARFRRRAGTWRKLVRPATHTITSRFADGHWLEQDPAGGDGFVEGNGLQYTMTLPQDAHGLARALGGRRTAVRRLDRFFTRLNAGPSKPYAFLGNEPGLGSPWLYDRLGRPDRTQSVVRRALLGLYDAGPAGLPGNDDGGTLSSWWVWAALGLYPVVPGRDVLAINGPLFPRVDVRLPHGRLTVIGHGAGPHRPYVHSLRLDGRPWRRTWIPFRRLASGRHVLEFRMGARPGRWGR